VSRIIAITPARNESTYLPMLAAAMEKQTLKPDLWMIVDDGSSDSTPDVAREFAATHSWVQLRGREDRGRYFRGKGVAETLGFGVTESNKLNPDWKLLAKIDADTYLPESYFNQVSDKFSENPRLGIASGVNAGERGIPTHPRGNNRVYRRECWDSMGGVPAISGWDTWDETIARARGWETMAFADITTQHLRPQATTVRYSYQQGKISRFLGYSWPFAFGRSLKISYERNPMCGLGYLAGYFMERSRIQDGEFVGLLKMEQYSRLRSLLAFGRSPAKKASLRQA
jgi:glycosyltransferase involved in cell wall biosynthesis